jgi:hypothetical protein
MVKIKLWTRGIFLAIFALVNLVALPKATLAAGCLSAVNAPGCSYGLPTEEYNQLLGVMAANPAPAARRLEVDEREILNYSDTRTKPARFASKFTGGLFDATPALPVAWVLRTTRAHVLPLWDADHVQEYVGRYTMVYLYATQKVQGENWYLIGPAQWLNEYGLARMILPQNPGDGGRWVSIDVRRQVLTAFEGDRLVFATLISSGKGTRPTRTGLFHVYLRQVTGDMSALMGTPDAYNIYDVPWVMYFNSGMALHGATWHDNYGTVMSHGCVNMSITDARWLFGWSESVPTMTVYVWRS